MDGQYANCSLLRQALANGPIEADVTTPVMGFRDEIIVRLTDEGESTFVDMRSASLFGSRDLGANARRIETFMSALDLRIQGGGG